MTSSFQADTARVIYSWHDEDPADRDSLAKHRVRGSRSVNLLGGLQNPPNDPELLSNFIIAAEDVSAIQSALHWPNRSSYCIVLSTNSDCATVDKLFRVIAIIS